MGNQERLGSFRPKLISIAVASCFVAEAVLANPTGHTVVHGTATFKEVGNVLRITNSPNAVINWHSFSIGANEITRFIQQSQSSAVLNRVVGSGGSIPESVILGTMKSNGRVFLLNPSGVLFGAGSTVDVAGLVAGSLRLSNADFLANRLRFTDGAGAGSVINQGNITTRAGGEVFLVGSSVTNGGVITSPGGDVILAAGNSVELVNPGTPNLRVEIAATDNQAVNLGQVVADSGRIGIYAGLINNSGTIRAGSAVAEGGRILLKAKQSVTLESSSILDASGAGGGTIEVLAKNGGTVNVAGRLDASAPTKGDGGFIETSADTVKVADGTVVTTAAAKGKTGTWLVDPNDYRISSAYGGDISGATLSSNLNSSDIQIVSDNGATFGSGTIYVDDPVSWSSGNSLTLLARGNVEVNQKISNTGSGGAKLYAGWDGGSMTTPVVSCCGSIYLYQPIELNQATGELWLVAGGSIYQSETQRIVANRLRADGVGGVFLAEAGNRVNVLAGRGDFFAFRNDRSLTVGTVGGTSGITAADGFEGQVFIDVTGAGNNLTVNQPIFAQNSSFDPALVHLVASGNLVVNNDITAVGSYGGAIGLEAGGSISVSNATISANQSGSFGSGALIGMSAGGAISVTNSTITANGGADPALVGMEAGTNIVLSGGTVSAISTADPEFEQDAGPTIVGLRAGNSVTLGGNVISQGGPGSPGWLSELPDFVPPDAIEGVPSDATGIAIRANNRIFGGAGVVGASSAQQIRMRAVNGIGTVPAPVKIANAAPVMEFLNTGASGDIAAQFQSGNVIINAPAGYNANPNGTYYIEAQAGSIELSVPFYPGEVTPAPLLPGQSVMLVASGDVHLHTTETTSGSITASGSGKVLIDAGGSILADSGTALGGSFIDLIAGSTITSNANITTGVVSAVAPGNITLNSASSLQLGLIKSTGGAVTLITGGSILDANPTGFNIEATGGATLNAAGGVGTFANPILTKVPTLAGSANSGFNVINTGNLNITGLNVYGGDANVKSNDGTLKVVGAVSVLSGNALLHAHNGVAIDQQVFVSGDLDVNSGIGDLGIGATSVHANNITLTGNNVFIGFTESTQPTSVVAQNLLKVTTQGNLNVIGGANAGAYAVLQGLDVVLNIGAMPGNPVQQGDYTIYPGINIIPGPGGAYAQIRAGSPDTITISYPNLAVDGYAVNGANNAIYDGSTSSGFVANNQPAVLGENLIVTYSGQPVPPTEPPISSTNDPNNAIKDAGQDLDSTPGLDDPPPVIAGTDPKGDKEKGLPVCN